MQQARRQMQIPQNAGKVFQNRVVVPLPECEQTHARAEPGVLSQKRREAKRTDSSFNGKRAPAHGVYGARATHQYL